MAEITKEKIGFTDELVRQPLIMAANVDVLSASIKALNATAKQAEGAVLSAKSTQDVNKATQDLTKTQTELERVQKQFTQSTQRLSDEYISNKNALNAVNQEVKAKLALGEREAKDVTAKNSSVTQLTAALEKNRLAYKSLTTEAERNSKSGQELLKIIQSQSKEVEHLNIAMGKIKEGGFREELEKMVASIGKFNPELKEAGEGVLSFGTKLVAVFASAPVLIAAAIGAVFLLGKKAVDTYLETTIEGEERAEIATSQWSAAVEILKDQYQLAGKVIFQLLGLQKESSSGFLSTLAGYAGFSKIQNDLIKRTQNAIDLAKLENEIRREEIKLTIELSEINLEKDKAMFEARDKIRNSDLERLEFLRESTKAGKEARELQLNALDKENDKVREAIKLAGYNIKNSQTSVDLLKSKVFAQTADFKLVQQLAELEAKVFDIEDKRYAGARRRQALEREIVDSIISREQANIKTSLTANENANIAKSQSFIDANSRIIGNEGFTLDQQLKANEENGELIIKVNNANRLKELAAAKDAAFSRVEIDRAAAKAIFDSESLTDEQKISMYAEEKRKAVSLNEAYQKEITSINTKYNALNQKNEKENSDKIIGIIGTDYAKQIEARKAFIAKDTNVLLEGLAEQYKSGAITTASYERQKERVQREANNELLDIELEYQERELQTIEDFLKSKSNLTQAEIDLERKVSIQISQVRLARAEIGTKVVISELQKQNLENNRYYNEAYAELNRQLLAKEITIKQYNRRLASLNRMAESEDLQAQIDNAQKELDELKEFLSKKAQLTDEDRAALQAAENKLSDLTNKKNTVDTEKYKEELAVRASLVKEFYHQVADIAAQVGDNLFAGDQQRIGKQQKQEQDSHDQAIALAGDNADLKAQIDRDYEVKKLASDKKLLESRQKQARFDKAIAAVQVVVKTAEAIADTLPLLSNPLTFALGVADIALISAIGLLQETAILSKPIPQFAKGGNTPGGAVIVGEEGPELLQYKGAFAISPGVATLMHLPKNTHVTPTDDTMSILAQAAMGQEASIDLEQLNLYNEIQELRRANDKNAEAIISALYDSAPANIATQAGIAYEIKKKRDGSKKIRRSKSLNS